MPLGEPARGEEPSGSGSRRAAARWRRLFAASAGIFAALALLAWGLGPLPGEGALYETVLRRVSPEVVSLFRALNYLGDKRLLLPATLVLLGAAPGARARWWLWAGVMVSAPVLEGLTKLFVGRPRPEGDALGFPSGHATAAAAFFFLAAHLLGRRVRPGSPGVVALWAGAAFVVALVGTARVVLQAHWPVDALAGAALGLACVALAAWWDVSHPRRAP